MRILPSVRSTCGFLWLVLVRKFTASAQATSKGGDEFVVGLWRQPTNPRQPLEVAGFPVRFFEVEDGKQCPFGFDEETMSVVTNLKEFTP